ncbi:hypothetical protein EYF80_037449 [Liparis tanakae]|uniref:Uncharacterized protein n=1 Tax=Liparis tanakae TaxID=230148 RepID=A0A4Z2GFR5_9TELE|nr:hypothetical protein EYF80_037449 [Liparis tanakae]
MQLIQQGCTPPPGEGLPSEGLSGGSFSGLTSRDAGLPAGGFRVNAEPSSSSPAVSTESLVKGRFKRTSPPTTTNMSSEERKHPQLISRLTSLLEKKLFRVLMDVFLAISPKGLRREDSPLAPQIKKQTKNPLPPATIG